MARIVDFVDGANSETTPTIGNIVASDLVQYPDDATYEATEQGAPDGGNIYFNTTDNTIRYYNGSTWQEVIDENTTQAVENKSIDADNNMITNIDNNEIKPGAGIEATKIADGSVDNTEFQYINSLSSNAQDQLDAKQNTSEKGVANGYASLDSGGKVPSSQIPPVALSETAVVADNAARDALTVQEGDTANTLDSGKWWIYDGSTWLEMTTPATVNSVNGQTGTVSLSIDDISDVDTTTSAPTDGQVLTWNNSNSEWEPQDSATASESVVSKVANYTATTDDDVILCDASSAFTITLYAASGNSGKKIKVKKTDSSLNAVTIDGNAAELIDGNADTTLNTVGEAVVLVCDGTGWQIMDRHIPQIVTSYTPTLVGLGTVTLTSCTWTRTGKFMEINVRADTGTVNASEIQWGLPGTLSIESSITGPIVVGSCVQNSASAANPVTVLATQNDPYLNMGNASGASAVKAEPAGGTTLFVNSTTISFFARIPINEWNG